MSDAGAFCGSSPACHGSLRAAGALADQHCLGIGVLAPLLVLLRPQPCADHAGHRTACPATPLAVGAGEADEPGAATEHDNPFALQQYGGAIAAAAAARFDFVTIPGKSRIAQVVLVLISRCKAGPNTSAIAMANCRMCLESHSDRVPEALGQSVTCQKLCPL